MSREEDLLSAKSPANAEMRDTGTAASVLQLQPRFVRLPTPGSHCPFTGLSRTQIYLMCKFGKIKSHSLKRPGTCRGVRLIDYQSLVAAIEEFASDEEHESQLR